MAVEDEVSADRKVRTEGSSSSSSFIRDFKESDEKRDVLSPEDIAWVDSCLIKESEISDGNWNSMKEALLELLSSQPESYNSCASMSDGRPTENNCEMLTSREGAEADQFLEIGDEIKEFTRTPNDTFSVEEEAENINGNFLTKDIDDLQSLALVGNPFLPTYVNGLKETQTIKLGADSSLSVDEIEPSTNDIFRVWDLNIPAEENELDNELNKILEESDLQPEPLAFDNSSTEKDLKEESLDDVIAAISEISLK